MPGTQMDDVEYLISVFGDPDMNKLFSYTPFKGLEYINPKTKTVHVLSHPTSLQLLVEHLRMAVTMHYIITAEASDAQS